MACIKGQALWTTEQLLQAFLHTMGMRWRSCWHQISAESCQSALHCLFAIFADLAVRHILRRQAEHPEKLLRLRPLLEALQTQHIHHVAALLQPASCTDCGPFAFTHGHTCEL